MTDWPAATDYKTCPRCLSDTDYSWAGTAMLVSEATREVQRIKFDRYYAAREEKREKRGEPSPESIGALEAREEVRPIKDLEQEYNREEAA